MTEDKKILKEKKVQSWTYFYFMLENAKQKMLLKRMDKLTYVSSFMDFSDYGWI